MQGERDALKSQVIVDTKAKKLFAQHSQMENAMILGPSKNPKIISILELESITLKLGM